MFCPDGGGEATRSKKGRPMADGSDASMGAAGEDERRVGARGRGGRAGGVHSILENNCALNHQIRLTKGQSSRGHGA